MPLLFERLVTRLLADAIRLRVAHNSRTLSMRPTP